MKTITKYITEKLKIGKSNKPYNTCQPKDKAELKEILKERLTQDKDADLNDIDVSKITDMYNLFEGLDPHNIDISEWDVSNVVDMSGAFYKCKNFNCDLSGWDVSKVEDMHNIFYECEQFDCNLGDWNISRVKNMSYMFYDCKNFKGEGLENWRVSNGTYTYEMFKGCDSLKI